MEDTELPIAPEIFDEILRSTDMTRRLVPNNERILRKAMVALVKSGHATFLFLRLRTRALLEVMAQLQEIVL
jgi:hypothetical protein